MEQSQSAQLAGNRGLRRRSLTHPPLMEASASSASSDDTTPPLAGSGSRGSLAVTTSRRPRALISDSQLQRMAALGDKSAARKMRNRESAAMSRKRRREQMDDLRAEVDTLKAQ